MTSAEAAKKVHVSTALVQYWARHGEITKHFPEGKVRNYLVDLDEVRQRSKVTKRQMVVNSMPEHIITVKEAAALLDVSERHIVYYCQMGYIKQYFVFPSKRYYMVDRDDILAQPGLSVDRAKHVHRRAELIRQEREQPRDERGFWKKKEKA